MELKNYQKRVMKNLSSYLDFLNQYDMKKAWSEYWAAQDVAGGSGGVPQYRDEIKGVPHICFKVPTGGGKTFMACSSLKPIFEKMPLDKPKVVVWLAPSDAIIEQTIKTLSDVNHAYRQRIDRDFSGKVGVYTKEQLLNGQNFSPDTVKEMLTICVLSYASLRVDSKKKDVRKVYQENGNLKLFADYFKDDDVLLADTDETALIQALRHLEPVAVVDESHNASSNLSVEMLNNLNPSFILDLTATPRKNSNILSYVDARELKKENMVKLPVVVYNRDNVKDVLRDAVKLRGSIEQQAQTEQQLGGEYIRPIVLFQAEPKSSSDTVTFEKLKDKLINIGIPQEQIAIKTSNVNELKGVNLLSPTCEIRYIITVNALKEGWDCPFAYILASVANKTSRVDVEQILGRILRQPHAKKHRLPLLNTSYVLTSSMNFRATLDDIVAGLNKAGFSRKDYRVGESEKPVFTPDEGEQQTIPEPETTAPTEESGEDWLDMEIPDDFHVDTSVVSGDDTIEKMVATATQATEKYDEELNDDSNDGFLGGDLGEMLNQYPIQEQFKEDAAELRIPQFFLKGTPNLFSDGYTLLERENLSDGFSLNKIPADIKFTLATGEIITIDIAEQGEAIPKYRKATKSESEQIREYLRTISSEHRIDACASSLTAQINKNNRYATEEVKAYVKRVISEMDEDALNAMESSIPFYASIIRDKIEEYETAYRQKRFDDLIEMNKIVCRADGAYSFPKVITPSVSFDSLDKSLYTAECSDLNNFEFALIGNIVSLENVLWWHRVIDRRGFRLNGFINHYPDFIVKTKSGNIILVEAKGEQLKNDDSKAKLALGKKWDYMCGEKFKYYMVFEKSDMQIHGSYTMDRFIEILRNL